MNTAINSNRLVYDYRQVAPTPRRFRGLSNLGGIPFMAHAEAIGDLPSTPRAGMVLLFLWIIELCSPVEVLTNL